MLPTAIWSLLLIGEDSLLVGAQGEGIFNSGDRGRSWSQSRDGWVVTGLVEGGDQMVYAALDVDGITRSSDFGESWEELDLVFEGVDDWMKEYVIEVLYDAKEDLLYAMNSRALARSRDGGGAWEQIPLPEEENLYLSDMVLDREGALLVASNRGLFR